ncbi:MAG TPA: alpha-amylase family glycosyl hydrolase [Chroococcales cyanobacterium]|jgi:glycosidase
MRSIHRVLCPCLILALCPLAAASTRTPTPFTFHPAHPVRSVSLVGNFNAWDASCNPMTLDKKTNTWRTQIELPPGEHSYKFALGGKSLVTDPKNKRIATDGFGGTNSLIKVPPLSEGSSVPQGETDPRALSHQPRLPDLTPLGSHEAFFRLNSRRGDLKEVRLKINSKTFPLSLYARTSTMDCFHVKMKGIEKKVSYSFRLRNQKNWHSFGPSGLDKPGEWKIDLAKATAVKVPAWAKGATLYQVFPERFFNGDPKNDPQPVQKWGNAPTTDNFFGGDLAGIDRKLEHLSRLGVEALYLNPIFEASTNHKYNTTDYLKIDPSFGNQRDFEKLRDDCHQRRIKLMLDGVFNHTGTAFQAFREASKVGPKSPYWNWYPFYGFPVVQDPKPNYLAWWGYASLPKLNNRNPEVRKYLLSVGNHWIDRGIDGWRLDVPNEVPQDFWLSFRQEVTRRNPQALIVGEIWDDGTPWLDGRHFDSVMNYRFRNNLLDLVGGKISGRDFGERMAQIRADYPEPVADVLLNLIGSHDTSRFLTECDGSKEKLKLAAFLQFTYPGMPTIYYGDEIGMEGGKDPDNRRTMNWKNPDRELFGYYQGLVQLRKKREDLKNGDFREIESLDPGVYAFLRGRDTLVIVNSKKEAISPREIVPLAKKARPLYPSKALLIPPLSGCVLSIGG